MTFGLLHQNVPDWRNQVFPEVILSYVQPICEVYALAEQNQDLRLTGDAMRLVLEDFMAQMKELKDQMSSMQSKHVEIGRAHV